MKNIYLLIISFSLISCYTYKVKAESDETTKESPAPSKPVKSNAVAETAIASPQVGISQVEAAIPRQSKIDKTKGKRVILVR